MAVTATPVPGKGTTSNYRRAWDLIATADADTTTGNIAHGLAITADQADQEVVVTIEPIGVKAYAQAWVKASIDATNIVLTKTLTGAGSGDAAAQVRVHVEWRASSYA